MSRRDLEGRRSRVFDAVRLPANEDDALWELFHENSKLGPFLRPKHSDLEVATYMAAMAECLPYTGYPTISLPAPEPIAMSLHQAITTRVSPKQLDAVPISLDAISVLLQYGYGVTRPGAAAGRSLRAPPSGGGLYPLEMYVYSQHIPGVSPGLFHYHPINHELHIVRTGEDSERLKDAIIYSEFVSNASMLVFITALFERSTFKYGTRGYRFILLEAGHVAQNINLTANALGLGALNMGGYFDRQVDEILEIDGVTQSAIYTIAIGKPVSPSDDDATE